MSKHLISCRDFWRLEPVIGHLCWSDERVFDFAAHLEACAACRKYAEMDDRWRQVAELIDEDIDFLDSILGIDEHRSRRRRHS